jgi:hypothetical protein
VRLPERGGAPTEVRATAQVSTTCNHISAQLRAEALAFNLAAVNAGHFQPSTTVLESLEHLAWSTAWELAAAS